MGFWKDLFKSSDSVKTKKALENFDGYLTANTLAMNAAENIVSDLEEAGYSKSKIRSIVEKNMPDIIKLVEKNSKILKLAEESSKVVVDRDEVSKDLTKDLKKKVKGDDKEDKEIEKKLLDYMKRLEKKKVTEEEVESASKKKKQNANS